MFRSWFPSGQNQGNSSSRHWCLPDWRTPACHNQKPHLQQSHCWQYVHDSSVCWILFLSSRFFTSSLCTSDIGTKYFSVLCLTMEGIKSSIFPVFPKKILRLRYCTYFWIYRATASVTQKYFIVSGIVTRNSVHKWKKWSIAWREVKITAVWSKTEIFLLSELFRWKALHFDKWAKIYFHTHTSRRCRSKEISLMPVSAATQVLS